MTYAIKRLILFKLIYRAQYTCKIWTTNWIYNREPHVQLISLHKPWKFYTTPDCNGCDILLVLVYYQQGLRFLVSKCEENKRMLYFFFKVNSSILLGIQNDWKLSALWKISRPTYIITDIYCSGVNFLTCFMCDKTFFQYSKMVNGMIDIKTSEVFFLFILRYEGEKK